MKKNVTLIIRCCLFILLATCLSNACFAQATLSSDENSYAPGSTCTLTGSGFNANETVRIRVVHTGVDGDNSTSAAHQPWYINADANGDFQTTWDIPVDQDEIGAYLVATADGRSGDKAECFFKDDVNGYTSANTSIPGYSLLSGATTVTVANTDDAISSAQNIGFTFNFGFSNFTQFKMNTNGWITFNTASTSTTQYTVLSSSETNVIAGFTRDLITTNMSYLLTGVSPNQILKIQWNGISSFSSTVVPATGSFQIWLYEGSNNIEVRYGPFTAGTRTVGGAVQVGLKGTSTATPQILALSGTNWPGAVFNNLSTSTVALTTTALPAADQVIQFNAPPPCSGMPTGGTTASTATSVCGGVNFTLSLDGATAAPGLTYQWQKNTGSGFVDIAGANSSSLTINQTEGTDYHCVITCTSSGMSASSSDLTVAMTCTSITGGTTLASLNPVCSGTAFTLSLSGASSTCVSYQWQSSPDNMTYTNITGATLPTSSASQTVPTYYRCQITCTGGSATSFSAPLLVGVTSCINMANGSTTTCAANFFDNGGSTGVYTANQNLTYTFFPTGGNAIQLVFSSFVTEAGLDLITIYDGPNASSPVLFGPLGGTLSIPTFVASDPSGAITVKFTSNATNNLAGWVASVSCIPLVACSGTPSPGNTISSVNPPCAGTQFTLSFQNNASGQTYQWQQNTGAGFVDIPGATSASLTTSQTLATNYQCIVTCTASGLSATSTDLLLPLNNVANCPLTVTPGGTATQIAQTLVGPGVTVSNAVLNCNGAAFGTFAGGASNLGLTNGIILTSGSAVNLIGPNTGNSSTVLGTPGDPQLDALTTSITHDACSIEFDLIPICDNINFNYVFGSEEYPDFVNSAYNDVFAFFISGPGIVGTKNIAEIPGPNIPVTINNLNNGFSSGCPTTLPGPCKNCQYYINNCSGTTIQYDGFTTAIAASTSVITGATYHLKIAIADAGDSALDSGVMLQSSSLTCVTTEVVEADAIENCQNGQIRFCRGGTAAGDTTINFTIGGSAINGVDYNTIPSSITIPSGQLCATLNIVAIEDHVVETPENFTLTYTNSNGNPVTLEINVLDGVAVAVSPASATICTNSSVVLTASGADTYSWSPGSGLSATSGSSVTAQPSSTTVYTVTGRLTASGCQESTTVEVTVLPLPTITCPADFTVFNDPGACGAIVNFTGIYAATATGADPVTITYSPASGSTFSVGTHQVTATATDSCGSVSCTFNVTVEDNEAPVITCVPNITVNTEQGLCSAVVTYAASATDNCEVPVITYSPASGSTFNKGTSTVTVTAKDSKNNTSTCTFTVTVEDHEAPTITCPPGITAQCTAPAANIGSVSTSDNCSVAVTVTWVGDVTTPGNCPSRYTVARTYKAKDAAGNSSTCTQTITVNDDIAPVISCPATANINTTPGLCTSSSSIGTATATDGCGGTVTISQLPLGPYPVGTTTVTWKATDACGNFSTCTQQVIVKDNEAPIITCPANVVINNTAGQCTATGINLGTPTVSDNCGILSVTNNAPSVYYLGNTTVTWTAKDVNGNTKTCTQIVTVNITLTHNAFTNFNASSNPGTATSLWLNIHTKLTSTTLPVSGNFIMFTNGKITLSGVTSNPLISNTTIPSGKIIADNTVTAPTTSYNAILNLWTTKVPPGYASSDIFIAGGIFNSANGFAVTSGKQSVVSGQWVNNSGSPISSSWFYGLSCYQPKFSYSNIQGAGLVTSVGTNGLQAGVPVPVKSTLVQGGSGGGGSNYTGSYSSTDNFVICPTTNYTKEDVASMELKSVSSIRLYPNPAQNQVTIEFIANGDAPYQVAMYDMVGRMILSNSGTVSEGENRIEFPFDVVADGIYTIRLTVGDEAASGLLVVKN